MTFRTRTFIAVFVCASLAVGVATWLVESALRGYMRQEIERTLVSQARLTAVLLSHSGPLTDPDAEADDIGKRIGARVTFIAADGRVLGDSEVDAAAVPMVENHASREEVAEARASGEGVGVRRSHTTAIETLYAASAVTNSPVAVARVALPLTAI